MWQNDKRKSVKSFIHLFMCSFSHPFVQVLINICQSSPYTLEIKTKKLNHLCLHESYEVF